MFQKIFEFFVKVALNGFTAIYITLGLYIIFVIMFFLLMIPVSIILGNGVVKNITEIVRQDISLKIIYTIVFISMMKDDLGIPDAKTIFNSLKKVLKRNPAV